ncbi:MAG: toxin-antitoxin system HicB family antitoxin [Pirellulaceae bacterium]
MTESTKITPFGRKLREVERVAAALLEQQPDWGIFFREVLGIDGAAYRLFSTNEEMTRFTESEAYIRIQRMLTVLRESSTQQAQPPTRVITVRVPASLHETLRAEARRDGISLNRLCVSRLLLEDE